MLLLVGGRPNPPEEVLLLLSWLLPFVFSGLSDLKFVFCSSHIVSSCMHKIETIRISKINKKIDIMPLQKQLMYRSYKLKVLNNRNISWRRQNWLSISIYAWRIYEQRKQIIIPCSIVPSKNIDSIVVSHQSMERSWDWRTSTCFHLLPLLCGHFKSE